MSYDMSSLLWLVVVIALIPLSLWLVRRTPIGHSAPGAPRSVAVLPLSNAQRLVTVEVGVGDQRSWVVLGVTPSSITTLYTMSPGSPAIGAVVPPGPAFAALLARLRQPSKGDDGL